MNTLTTAGQRDEIVAGVGIQTENNFSFAGNQGAVASPTLFTVTGVVAVKLIGVVTSTLTSGGTPTIEVGTAITTAGILAQVTDATGLAVNEIWHDATPDASVELSSVMAEKIVTQDIKVKIASAAITAGRIRFICLWRPLSVGASVASAVTGDGISTSPSLSPSVSPSSSASASISPSASASPSASRSPSASISPSSSASSSVSPSASQSPSASRSPSASVSPSSSVSPSASNSPSFGP